MRRWSLVLVAVVAVGALSVASCNMDRSGHNTIRGGGLSMERPPAGCPSCDSAMKHDGWCEKCNSGFINGTKVSCKSCVDAYKGHMDCKACGKKMVDMPRK